ncbi:hypothetical protein Tco_1130184 [Tanacetum coccineum]
MSTNNIAICQSSGEFLLEIKGSMLYRGGEAYAVDLDTDSSTLIMISKDKDLRRMINFFKDSDQVDVFVMPQDGGTGALIVLNMPAIRDEARHAGYISEQGIVGFQLGIGLGILDQSTKEPMVNARGWLGERWDVEKYEGGKQLLARKKGFKEDEHPEQILLLTRSFRSSVPFFGFGGSKLPSRIAGIQERELAKAASQGR